MNKIKCAFEGVGYDNGDFKVLHFSTDDYSARFAPKRSTFAKKYKYGFKAVLNGVSFKEKFNKRHDYILEGEWKDTNYGLSFEVDFVNRFYGSTEDETKKFLLSLYGVGKALAKKIYAAFGNDAARVLRDEQERLRGIGITEKQLKKINIALNTESEFQKVLSELSKFSLSRKKIRKIFDAYKEKAIDTVTEMPFFVSEAGIITFLEANSIAIDLHTDLQSNNRRKQALKYVASVKYRSAGNLYYKKSDLCDSAAKFLNIGLEKSEQCLSDDLSLAMGELISSGSFVEFGDCVYFKRDFFAEKRVGQIVTDFCYYPKSRFKMSKSDVYAHICNEEKNVGFKLNDEQKNAVYTALSSNISVITGGPGTGKTTILKFLLNIFESEFGDNIALCSPTGKAAKRMAESTGNSKACTIHNLLHINPDFVWSIEKIPIDKLTYDLIVIDESSMIDMELMFLLLNSISFQTKIVFVGDVDQLPSVGPGNVLKEIIDSGVVPVAVLNRIYRQSEQSNIVKNAHLINAGNSNYIYDNSSFIIKKARKSIDEQISEIYFRLIKKGYKKDEVQILTPYRTERYHASTGNLNRMIQDKINPIFDTSEEIEVGRINLRVGDRVIQQVNNSKGKNGDVGTVTQIITAVNGSKFILVKFDDNRIVEFSIEQIEESKIDLAYALTVHKSQGSEYKIVIMPSLKEHQNMLTRKLVYTAWTRAKEHVVIVGDKSPLEIAANNVSEISRNTALRLRIVARNKKWQQKLMAI